jgi:hypothetical protein
MLTKIIITTGIVLTIIYQAQHFIIRVARLMMMPG